MLPKSRRLEQYVEDLMLISKTQDYSSRQRILEDKASHSKKRKHLSHRLSSLHREGTMKIQVRRNLLDSDEHPSKARNVTLKGPTERQLLMYTQGVSKLRDKLCWKSKNRDVNPPKGPTERQLLMHAQGLSKLLDKPGWTSKNRDKNAIGSPHSPQKTFERQVSMYTTIGMIKLRKGLAKSNSDKFTCSIRRSGITDNSSLHFGKGVQSKAQDSRYMGESNTEILLSQCTTGVEIELTE